MKLNRYLSHFECFVYLFLYVFGVLLPVIRTSSLLLGIVLPLRFLFMRGGFDIAKKMIMHPYVVKILGLYFFIICYLVLITTIHLQFDFTLLPALINNILHLMIGILLVSLMIYKKFTSGEVLELLIGIFVAQSIIQIVAFFSPALLSFIQLFQEDSTIDLAMSQYGGNRGLALAGSNFFGLAVAYGLVFLLLIKKCIDRRTVVFRDIICSIILFVGGFFTGRTFFIGVAIAGLFCFFFVFLY